MSAEGLWRQKSFVFVFKYSEERMLLFDIIGKPVGNHERVDVGNSILLLMYIFVKSWASG